MGSDDGWFGSRDSGTDPKPDPLQAARAEALVAAAEAAGKFNGSPAYRRKLVAAMSRYPGSIASHAKIWGITPISDAAARRAALGVVESGLPWGGAAA